MNDMISPFLEYEEVLSLMFCEVANFLWAVVN